MAVKTSEEHIQITVGGETYGTMLVKSLSAYQEKDVSSFSPKISSGDLGYSDLSIWNTAAQEDFSHGFGHREFDDPKGYHRSEGSIDTRHVGVAQLATQIVASDQDLTAQVYQFLDGKPASGYLWAATGAGLRVFDDSDDSWAACTDTNIDNELIYSILNNGQYLFISSNGARIRKLDLDNLSANPEATATTTAGLDTNATDYRFLALGGGRMWGSKDADNHIHYSTSADGSDLEGDSSDTNRITVGAGNVPITALQYFNGYMYVTREDGLWAISLEDDVARQVLDWTKERRTTNGKGMLVWNNKLVIPVGPRLFVFTGYTVSEITPPVIGNTFPYISYGNFEAMTTYGPYLYVAAQRGTASGTLYSEVLRPSGAGSSTEWTADSGSNYARVDDATPDYFSTYVKSESSTSTGHTDLYAMGNTSAASGKTITKVTLHVVCAMSAYEPGLYGKLYHSGSTSTGAGQALTVGWEDLSWDFTDVPGGSGWTSAQVDALEAGMTSYGYDGGAFRMSATQVYIEVFYTESTAPYDLLCYDGSAWHNLGSLEEGGKALYVSAETDDLWINDYNTSDSKYDTRYMQVQEHSFLPYDSYDGTDDTHILYTSRIDGGLKAIDKCFHELHVHTQNCTATRVITVHYRTSGDTWVELDDVDTSPIQTISLSNITGKYIEFKFVFDSDAAAQSPILEAWALEWLPHPDTVWGYNLTLEAGDKVKKLSGKTTSKTAREFRTALRDARESTVPITIKTPYEDSVEVIITAYNLTSWQLTNKGVSATININAVSAA